MSCSKRPEAEPTHDRELLRPLFGWPEQRAYEEPRPLVLFGGSVAERAGETGKPKTAGEARLFETPYVLPQLRLFALDGGGWLKVLKLEGYTPQAARRSDDLAGGAVPLPRRPLGRGGEIRAIHPVSRSSISSSVRVSKPAAS